MNKICVIGGGASGIMAALSAAKNGAKVTVFEGNEELGKKILRTGNGKCNFSNLNMTSEVYNCDSDSFVENILSKYGLDELLLYLSRLGLLIKEKNGYLYPYSEQARSVRDVFEAELRSLCVNVRTSSYVNMLTKDETGGFLVSVEGIKEREHFDKVILCTGGKAGLLKNFDIKITPLEAGLTKINCKEDFLKDLDGIRAEANVSLYYENTLLSEEYGEVLFREKGISGICVFILSSLCKNNELSLGKYSLKLDLFPGFDEEDLKKTLEMRFLVNAEKNVKDFFKGLFCDGLNDLTIKQGNLDPQALITSVGADRIIDTILKMRELNLTPVSKAGFDNAQVTVGGVETDELTDNLESKKVPGLYVCGELVNVDGPCGGYNLQWAFSSGAIAGEHACY